jgi:DNA-binding Xre family transcriptional regulator
MAYKKNKEYPVHVDNEDLHFRMLAAMHVAGLSVRDVADFMSVSPQYVHMVMQGQNQHLNIDFLVNFCAYVGCTVADILPFVNSELPIPGTRTVLGGGIVTEIALNPYRITYSDAEDLRNKEVAFKPLCGPEE